MVFDALLKLEQAYGTAGEPTPLYRIALRQFKLREVNRITFLAFAGRENVTSDCAEEVRAMLARAEFLVIAVASKLRLSVGSHIDEHP